MRSSLKGPYLLLCAARHAAREPRSALLVARMAWWVLVLTFLMRTTSLTRALRIVSRKSRGLPPADVEEVQVRLARSLDLLLSKDFWVFTPTCWKRAPVLQRFLALEGIETRVVFGVKASTSAGLNGHAWLERGGVPVLEATHPDYVPTFSHPA
jgi:hypothetical protein